MENYFLILQVKNSASAMLINLLEVTQLLSHRAQILAQVGLQTTRLTYLIYHSKPLREADSFKGTELAFNLPKEACFSKVELGLGLQPGKRANICVGEAAIITSILPL